jgi:glycosyltransferase involved in cell wall biosynthesis
MPAAGGEGAFFVMTANGFPDATRAALRIVMILPAYLPESFGGAEQQTRRLAQALARRGAVVTLISPRLEGRTLAWEREGPVVVRRFRLPAAPNLGGRHLDAFLWWCLCISSWLWRNRRGYDLIYIVHGRLHAFPAAVAGKWLGKPVVVKPGRGGETHFDLSVVQRKRLLGSFFARAIARNTTAWIANSQVIAGDLARWAIPRERVHMIPNGIEVPEDVGRQSRNGFVHFVSMGRLDADKAVDQTIRAFAALSADVPAHLTILGDGPCRRELEALSRRLGQEERIVFTGAVEDVAPYLKEADVYLSTSVSEGMSNSLLEAMSRGVMPVVSRVSGADDLIEEGVSGFLVPPGDETTLATRLAEALSMTSDRRHATGEAARAAICARFSLEKVVERHLTLYRILIEAGPCAKA